MIRLKTFILPDLLANGKVDDAAVRGVADAMVSSGMSKVGYLYVNIDDTWEGSRDREWARPFEHLAATLSQKTSARVKLAYLELMQPSLEHAIAELVGAGVDSIRVVPVFLGQGGHLKEDLPRLAASAAHKFPQMKIELAPAIGEQASVIEAIAAAIARGA